MRMSLVRVTRALGCTNPFNRNAAIDVGACLEVAIHVGIPDNSCCWSDTIISGSHVMLSGVFTTSQIVNSFAEAHLFKETDIRYAAMRYIYAAMRYSVSFPQQLQYFLS